MGNTVVYDSSFQRCDANLLGGPFTVISDDGRGTFRTVYEIAYAHYVATNGLTAKYTTAVVGPPDSFATEATLTSVLTIPRLPRSEPRAQTRSTLRLTPLDGEALALGLQRGQVLTYRCCAGELSCIAWPELPQSWTAALVPG